MKRKMITGERLMYVDASTPLNCVFTVKIRGNFTADRLRIALMHLQHKHPLLRAFIKDHRSGAPYFVFSDMMFAIPVRIVPRKGEDDWLPESEAEWKIPFQKTTLPLARVVWLKGDEVSELMLVCPHCICDGKSLVTLMGELLAGLDNPRLKLEEYEPFSSLTQLLSAKFTLGRLLKVKLTGMMALWFFYKNNKPVIREPGNNYMLHWKLDTALSAAVVQAAKGWGTSVHAILCVVFLEAFQAVQGAGAKGRTVMPVDIRRFIPEIREDMLFAMAPTIELGISELEGDNLQTKSRKFRENMLTRIEQTDGRDILLLSEHISVKGILGYLKSCEGSHDITLSNMGKLDIAASWQNFEVETIYSPSVAFPWRNPNTLIVTSFKGQMDFVLCSSDAYLSRPDAEAIRDKATEMLKAEMPAVY